MEGTIMSNTKLLLSAICVQLLLMSLVCPSKVESATSATEQLLTMMPDDVAGFVATSGGDDLKPAFEKTIISRIWNDPGVITFREAIKKELLAKAIQEMPELNEEGISLIESIIRQVTARPFVIGAARKDNAQGPPLYGFAILDAGPHKAEIAASLEKLESFADEGDIIEIDIPGRKLHLEVSEQELARRREHMKPLKKEAGKALRRYSLLATSADKGAVLRDEL